jgi:energy-converting hydrogenase Eha subunit F
MAAITVTKNKVVIVETEEQVKEPQAFTQPTATVGMHARATKNLGDYNSVQIGVSLEMPCYVGEQDAIYEFVKGWVDDRMEALANEVEENQGG